MKSTESLADIATRLLGIARSSPQKARVRRDALLASFLLASPPPKTLRGVKLANSALNATSPRATLSPTGTMRRTATKPGADVIPVAPHHPYKLEDTIEAGPCGPYVLLLCRLS